MTGIVNIRQPLNLNSETSLFVLSVVRDQFAFYDLKLNVIIVDIFSFGDPGYTVSLASFYKADQSFLLPFVIQVVCL